MNKEAKVIGIIAVIFLTLFGGLIYLATKPAKSEPIATPADTKLLVRQNSHQTNPGAPITIVEFGDFQCPACGTAYPIIIEVTKQYGKNVNLVFRNFPLPSHNLGQVSAQAAEAAAQQNKFWQMYDKLYQNQEKWSVEPDPTNTFTGYAKDLGLNVEKFKSDLNSEIVKNIIKADQQDAITLGIDSTPTFFINGQKAVGVPDINNLKKYIDQVLALIPSPNSQTASPVPTVNKK